MKNLTRLLSNTLLTLKDSRLVYQNRTPDVQPIAPKEIKAGPSQMPKSGEQKDAAIKGGNEVAGRGRLPQMERKLEPKEILKDPTFKKLAAAVKNNKDASQFLQNNVIAIEKQGAKTIYTLRYNSTNGPKETKAELSATGQSSADIVQGLQKDVIFSQNEAYREKASPKLNAFKILAGKILGSNSVDMQVIESQLEEIDRTIFNVDYGKPVDTNKAEAYVRMAAMLGGIKGTTPNRDTIFDRFNNAVGPLKNATAMAVEGRASKG